MHPSMVPTFLELYRRQGWKIVKAIKNHETPSKFCWKMDIIVIPRPITHFKCASPYRFLFIQSLWEKPKKFLMLIPTGAPAEAQPNAAHGEKGYYKEIKSKQRTHTPNIYISFALYIVDFCLFIYVPAWWMYRGVNSVYFVGQFVVAVENTCVRRLKKW